MIKINISTSTKKFIEERHLKDIKIRLENVFLSHSSKKIFRKHKGLKSFLFVNNDYKINNENLKILLLGNKNDLDSIIKEIGIIEDKRIYENIFQYNNFSKREWAKELLINLDVNVCPYCNRQYTFTLKDGGARPQFDHHFPKSFYPYLALSLYNLIPSCAICNLAKTSHDTYAEPLLYPYAEDFGFNTVFQTEMIGNDFLYWIGYNENYNITIPTDNDNIERAIKKLHLKELYNLHKDYVNDIIKNTIIYDDDKIRDLYNNFGELFSSEQEARDSIFMSRGDYLNWGNRPLAKLTFDIYNEFKIDKT